MKAIQLKWPSVGHLLQQAAQEHQDKTLFIYESQKLSYAEVDNRTNRVANALKHLGVGKGDKVSVMLPNGFEFPITWLAIAKLGAVIVPTNINYQERDLEYILSDSEASCMVIHSDYLSVLEKVSAKLPALKNVVVSGATPAGCHCLEAISDTASDVFEIKGVNENDLLNIQYTSGTTGFPKGCMLTHHCWLLASYWISKYLDLKAADIDLTAQPVYYADLAWNVVLCLMGGIPLVIMPKFSVSNFWPEIIKNKVTFCYMLGVMPNLLLKRPPDELEKKHTLRIVICSGIVPQLHATIEKRFNCPWREAYGLTEASMDFFVPIEDSAAVGSGAVGKSINPAKEARIVDSKGNPVPEGKTGELILRGDPMMLGYWKKPEATAAILRNGWCHTGDLAYRDEKGYLHLVGRIKEMVRRGAENISTAEIEGVLAEHPKILLSAVVPVPDPLRGEEVKAYVVLKKGENKDTVPPQAIIDFARVKLAGFKVPRYLEYVDSLPRTPSERVEKHKLIRAKTDLRLDCYDAEKGIWINESLLKEIQASEKIMG